MQARTSREPIRESITIAAPIERCFALSTRVELVKKTLGMSMVESGVPGSVTSGHIAANSRVLWRGWKFGLPIEHHTLITRFDPPHSYAGDPTAREAFFQDTQEKGRFASFQHDHFFRETTDSAGNPVTALHDEVRFSLPFGPLGRIAAATLMVPHIRRLARQRFAMIKELAEGEGWRHWIDANQPST